jgi:hypothetical protein
MTGIVIASSSVMIARLSDGEDEQDGGLKIDHESKEKPFIILLIRLSN